VWGIVPAGARDAANAVLLDAAGQPLSMVPIIDGRFAFRDLGSGQYSVALQTATGRELARSSIVDLSAGGEVEAIFEAARRAAAALPPAASPGGGIGTTGWILIGAAAAGIATAIVVLSDDDEDAPVASPTR
jgi:hypothetical protein